MKNTQKDKTLMDANDYLDIIEASTICGEDAECENCPLCLPDDCKVTHWNTNLYDKTKKAIAELRKIVGRSRIRKTVKEPPTKEDANFYGEVLARTKTMDEFYAFKWEAVAKPEYKFIEWTQFPKVTL